MRVYFTIKANSNYYSYFADSECTTAKTACSEVKSRVHRQSGRNAFTPFCKPRKPEKWHVEFMEKAEDWEESEFNMEKKS